MFADEAAQNSRTVGTAAALFKFVYCMCGIKIVPAGITKGVVPTE